MKGTLEILDAGMLTTIQDTGRFGYRKYGIPVCGVMDSHAYKLANWLVANPGNHPVLETTLKGAAFKFNTNAVIGISGAESEIFINDSPQQLNKTLKAGAGDVLRIEPAKKGCRTYLAIKGNWDIDTVMGSYSTCLAANIGGYKGRKLREGDRLSWTFNDVDSEPKISTVPKKFTPVFSNRQKIRIITGPEWQWLANEQQEKFLDIEFSISPQSNRMGIRLNGSQQFQTEKKEMSSSPVIPGIIQLPKDGNPIILMKDAQTIGGYPRIAKVVDADLWRLGQAWPPARVHFQMISVKEAMDLSAFQQNFLS